MHLDLLNRPEPIDVASREKHDRIIEAVKEVLELRGFSYSISSQTQSLVLKINGEHRPLGAVGTGYEHIFLLVGATVVHPDAFLCVEEPEIHAHPRLQRRLADYINESTTNQFLFSTHSATLIDALRGSTFRLALEGYDTHVSRPVARQVLDVFDDLGYRASDLLQANCVIWVEGPSDRIYLNAWITVLDSTLEEGIDYQIMFYGGSLLAHLTLSEDTGEDLDRIPIHRLNQRFVILADSDKRAPDSPLKERVARLSEESESEPHGHIWVTAGREIENYLPAERCCSDDQTYSSLC